MSEGDTDDDFDDATENMVLGGRQIFSLGLF